MKKLFFAILLIVGFYTFAEESAGGMIAEIETNRGTMEFSLDFDQTPLSVSAFICLSEGLLDSFTGDSEPFYDGAKFDIVAPGFAVQADVPFKESGFSLPRETESAYSADNFGVLCLASYETESFPETLIITSGNNNGFGKKITPIGSIIKGDSVLSRLKRGDRIKKITIRKEGAEYANLQINQSFFLSRLKEKRDAELLTLSESNSELAKGIRNFLGLEYRKSDAAVFHYFRIMSEGNGETVRVGNTVKTHFTGYFLDGTVFDSSRNKVQAFEFTLGENPVISGWEQSILSMKEGEMRRVVLPPSLGYGDNGFGPIPGGAWLMYEIEVIEINP